MTSKRFAVDRTKPRTTGKEKDADKRKELVAEGRRLRDEITEKEEDLRRLDEELKRRLSRIPNLTHPDAPIGQTEESNKVLRLVGARACSTSKPKTMSRSARRST